MSTCPKCSLHQMVSIDQAFEWVRRDTRWFEPDWWTRRRIDKAMAIREQMNRDYAGGLCRGLGHSRVTP